MPSGRFYGFVIGGSQPAALAADWLVSAWDQNTVLRKVTPAVAAVEEVAGDLVPRPARDCPPESGVGFATGATMANFTGLVAARDALLRRRAGTSPAGSPAHRRCGCWPGASGTRRPTSRCATSGCRRPSSSTPTTRAGSGRTRCARPSPTAPDQPTIVLLQAGNLHSGACDPFEECVAMAHEHGAWVHVDGAFGLWAAASPSYRHLTAGVELADSWATDAHKTLNVPYDCGIVAVRDAAALNAAMGAQGDYFIADAAGDPMDRVPEMSRRARGVPGLGGAAGLGPRRRRRDGRPDVPARAHLRRGDGGDPGSRGAQRRRLHPGVRVLRQRRAHPARSSTGCWPTASRGRAGRGGATGRCCGSRSATPRPPTTTSRAPSRRCGARAEAEGA